MNMYKQSDDEKMKKLALSRLLQLQSLDQMDALKGVLNAQRTRTGQCPQTWRDVSAMLRAMRFSVDASGAPLDPSGVPYVIKQDGCDVELGEKTEILRKY
jgi:hypothetical protein